MKWYMSNISPDSIVISSRVRLARNIDDYPFPPKLDNAGRAKVIQAVRDSLEKYATERYNYININERSRNEASVLVEDHLISKEFCNMPDTVKRTFVTDELGNVAVMIGEEDHLRIQSILPGLSLERAYELANAIDETIAKGVSYAYDEKLGYLTSCPTNLGTGMRASVMLHLPAIKECGYLKKVVELMTKIGLTVRGLYGEASEAEGGIYQISNQVTLGLSEKDTIEKLSSAVAKVVQTETELRKQLKATGGCAFEDRLWRTYGILTNARRISFSEFIGLWSDVRLGISCGIITGLRDKNLTALLINSMPCHIIDAFPEAKSSALRDEIRATKAREFFTAT